jgi:hypothetical protein
VADEDRRLVELTDQLGVMVDDLLEIKALEFVGLGAKLFDVTLLARPFGRGNVVAALREVVGEVLPAPRGEPGAVDQHQRGAVGGGRHRGLPDRLEATLRVWASGLAGCSERAMTRRAF